MATIDVKDAFAATVAIEKPLAPGRAAAASSKPIVLSTEDLAAVGSLTETAPASDTASSGLNGRLQRIAQRITSLIALLPASLGVKAASASLSVAQASATATIVTATASAASSATIVASNASRAGLIIVNTDSFDLYIKYGATASLASFTAIVPASGGQWEMPAPIYTGIIDGIWAGNGAGSAYPTELG